MRFLVILTVMIALLPSCSRETVEDSPVRAAAAKASLDSLWTRYARAADQRDRAAFGALFREDGVLVFSNAATVRGRPAIQEFLGMLYGAVDITGLRVAPEDLRVSGPLAAQSGTFEEEYLEAGARKTTVGRFTAVAERGDDEEWRFRRLVTVVDSIRSD